MYNKIDTILFITQNLTTTNKLKLLTVSTAKNGTKPTHSGVNH